jgi:Rod binding domain-containing protein
MQIDTALLQYANRPLRVPSGAPQVAGTGARVADTGPIDKKSKLFEQCQEFESIFVKMMLSEMQKTVDKSDDLMNGGWAEEVFQDQLYDEYAKSMTKTANFGLADQLYRQLKNA